jgi:outer membrane protein assembly factor BamA
VTQPYFLNPRNQLSVSGFAERRSEPGVFSREAVGGRLGVARRLRVNAGASVAIDVENGRTRASPALFCAAFLVCEPATIDSLSERRFRTELVSNYFMDQTDSPLDPTSGYLARAAMSYAPAWLGSQINFFRLTSDGSFYTEPRPRWVAAFSLRLGNFFRTATVEPTDRRFLPPEDRFYAGGASTVRGYTRNGLGPGVYVTDSDSIIVSASGDTSYAREPQFVPTGGTAVGIVNAELRLPSQFLTDILRLALVVDACAVGTGSVWDLGPDDWRITPGAGFRLQTPVGPVRLDIGYNPYLRPQGPVLLTDLETGGLRRIDDAYRPPTGNLFSRLRVHLGVGHAF